MHEYYVCIHIYFHCGPGIVLSLLEDDGTKKEASSQSPCRQAWLSSVARGV